MRRTRRRRPAAARLTPGFAAKPARARRGPAHGSSARSRAWQATGTGWPACWRPEKPRRAIPLMPTIARIRLEQPLLLWRPLRGSVAERIASRHRTMMSALVFRRTSRCGDSSCRTIERRCRRCRTHPAPRVSATARTPLNASSAARRLPRQRRSAGRRLTELPRAMRRGLRHPGLSAPLRSGQ